MMPTQDALEEPDEFRPKEWHKFYIDQLGYSINFFLITATGLIGFSISQLTNPQHCVIALKIAIWFLLFSMLSGVVCSLVRLEIFRIRRKNVKFEADQLVLATFISQIVTFVFGIFAIAAATFTVAS